MSEMSAQMIRRFVDGQISALCNPAGPIHNIVNSMIEYLRLLLGSSLTNAVQTKVLEREFLDSASALLVERTKDLESDLLEWLRTRLSGMRGESSVFRPTKPIVIQLAQANQTATAEESGGELEKENARLREELTVLRTAKERLEGVLERQIEERRKAEIERVHLVAEIDRLRADRATSENEITTMNGELRRLRAVEMSSTDEIEDLKSEKATLSEELRVLRAENERLRRDLEAQIDGRGKLETEKMNLVAEIDRLRADQAKSGSDVTTMTREVTHLREIETNSKREIEDLKRQNTRLIPRSALSLALSRPIQYREMSDFIHCLAGWNATLEFTECRDICFSDAFPLTNEDHWELRGWFQFIGRPGIYQYVGLHCLAASGQGIHLRHFRVVGETEAELAEACEVNDSVLKVRNGLSWPSKVLPHAPCVHNENVAFGPNELPNFNISSWIREIHVKNDVIEVELTEPITQSWPKGTAVRLHREGGTYHYCHGAPISSEWTEIIMNDRTHPLRPGTRSVKIIALVDHYDNKTGKYCADPTGCTFRMKQLQWRTLS
jgi:hypothetical protein